jgi:Ion channel
MIFLSKLNRPIFWGALYLLAIPFFALIYYNSPNSFYQSTATVERYTNGFYQKSKVEKDVYQAILESLKKSFKNHYRQDYPKVNSKYSQNDTTIEVHNMIEPSEDDIVKLKNDSIFFRISYYPNDSTILPIVLKFKVQPNLIVDENFENRPLDLENEKEVLEQPSIKAFRYAHRFLYAIFPLDSSIRLPFDGICIDCHGYIKIDKTLQKKINSLAFGLNGVADSEDFSKMFYLSAVTITTLGFGDIVPITPEARLLISIESILGVVIIGLFLNSVAKKIISRRT